MTMAIPSLADCCDDIDDRFIPTRPVDSNYPFTGRRRTTEQTPSIPLRWPKDAKARYELFDAWHDVGMQLVHRAKAGLHVMAAAKKVVMWRDGTIISSNSELAARAGCCSEKTISREIKQYVDLGILIADMGWRRIGSQIVRTRSLRPALPVTLPAGVALPENCHFDLDNSGPDGSGFDLDNSGPGDLDNSGPVTIETIISGGVDANR